MGHDETLQPRQPRIETRPLCSGPAERDGHPDGKRGVERRRGSLLGFERKLRPDRERKGQTVPLIREEGRRARNSHIAVPDDGSCRGQDKLLQHRFICGPVEPATKRKPREVTQRVAQVFLSIGTQN
jgi:hypothetical protein